MPCLLCGRRATVLLIGVEGFPHSCFRHFIRYVNIRGVRPEERGERKRRRAGLRDAREECVSCTRNQTSKKERQKGEIHPVPYTINHVLMCVCVCSCVCVGVRTLRAHLGS